MPHLLAGLYPALPTPLDSQYHLKEDVAAKLLHHLLAAGMDGVYVAGSTGEGLRLPKDTRKALVELLMRELPTDKKLLVHVGTAKVEDAIELAEHAARCGAHAISSLPPQADAAGVQAYYQKLAQESALPLILYFFPKVAPNAFTDPQQLLDACDLPNVVGVKFTDFNLYLMQRLVNRGKLVFNGYDEVFAAGLLMGAQGGIGSTYNLMPEAYRKILTAAKSGDWDAARRCQADVNQVIEVLAAKPFFPALRAVLKHEGFDCGPLLSGERLDSEDTEAEIVAILQQKMPAGLLPLLVS